MLAAVVYFLLLSRSCRSSLVCHGSPVWSVCGLRLLPLLLVLFSSRPIPATASVPFRAHPIYAGFSSSCCLWWSFSHVGVARLPCAAASASPACAYRVVSSGFKVCVGLPLLGCYELVRWCSFVALSRRVRWSFVLADPPVMVGFTLVDVLSRRRLPCIGQAHCSLLCFCRDCWVLLFRAPCVGEVSCAAQLFVVCHCMGCLLLCLCAKLRVDFMRVLLSPCSVYCFLVLPVLSGALKIALGLLFLPRNSCVSLHGRSNSMCRPVSFSPF